MARRRRERVRFAVAIACSLLLHALVLLLRISPPTGPQQQAASRSPGSRVDVTLSQPQKPEPSPRPPSPRERQTHVLAMPPKPDSARADVQPRSWTRAERDDMDQFLNELDEEARPPTGKALAQRALTMARNMHSAPEESAESKEANESMRKLIDARVDPFSIEMYFDALFRKMNRSAAMIGNEKRSKGIKVASVLILLNRDGSVRNFKVLREADQQGEIAFIQEVVEQAAPFPVFPDDIRRATDAIALLICIRPDGSGGGGATFSRMADGQACR